MNPQPTIMDKVNTAINVFLLALLCFLVYIVLKQNDTTGLKNSADESNRRADSIISIINKKLTENVERTKKDSVTIKSIVGKADLIHNDIQSLKENYQVIVNEYENIPNIVRNYSVDQLRKEFISPSDSD